MPLTNVLSFDDHRSSGDPAPISADLIKNIEQIMLHARPDTDIRYSVDEVLTGIVYAFRSLELKVVHTDKVLASLIGNTGMSDGPI